MAQLARELKSPFLQGYVRLSVDVAKAILYIYPTPLHIGFPEPGTDGISIQSRRPSGKNGPGSG